MPSLWKTGQFRVQAHKCDRDYMHLEGLRGCAPRVTNDNSAMGILNQLTKEQHFESPIASRNTIAQTIERLVDSNTNELRRFINMVGRPDKDALGPTYRSTGFMSMGGILEDQFKRCSEIEQCFRDKFTYNGEEKNRHIVNPSGGGLIPWQPQDADICGGFGFPVDKSNCPGLTDTLNHECCAYDRAVLPMYELFCRREDFLDPISATCNPAEATPILSVSTIQDICDELGTHFVVYNNNAYIDNSVNPPRTLSGRKVREPELENRRHLLNQLLDEIVPDTPISSYSQYLQTMDCSKKVWDSIQQATQCNGEAETGTNPYCTSYHSPPSQTVTPNEETKPPARSGVYYMLKYTLHEVRTVPP